MPGNTLIISPYCSRSKQKASSMEYSAIAQEKGLNSLLRKGLDSLLRQGKKLFQ